MAENTNMNLTVEAWAEIVIEKWELMIDRYKVNHSGNLLKSFYHHVVTQADGVPSLIEFTFEYYGKFVDMGVGRGVSIGDVELSERRRKPWYSKVFFSQVKRLSEILADKYARKAQLTILSNVEAFDEQGNKSNSTYRTASKNTASKSPSSGNQKMSFSEFEKNRKANGW